MVLYYVTPGRAFIYHSSWGDQSPFPSCHCRGSVRGMGRGQMARPPNRRSEATVLQTLHQVNAAFLRYSFLLEMPSSWQCDTCVCSWDSTMTIVHLNSMSTNLILKDVIMLLLVGSDLVLIISIAEPQFRAVSSCINFFLPDLAICFTVTWAQLALAFPLGSFKIALSHTAQFFPCYLRYFNHNIFKVLSLKR